MYKKFGKRILDLVLSIIFIIMFWWIFLIVGYLVKKKLGTPILFKQKRPGKNGKIFEMYKFRSMTNEKDGMGNLLPDSIRLTDFGKKLRSTSLDEIPQIFNVLKGEMSLVGPRPLVVIYLERYSKKQMRRHEVLPGITGWAQVNGRNAISWDKKFEYDVEYVDKYNLIMDIKIIFMTLKKVFIKEGIAQSGDLNIRDFMGDNSND